MPEDAHCPAKFFLFFRLTAKMENINYAYRSEECALYMPRAFYLHRGDPMIRSIRKSFLAIAVAALVALGSTKSAQAQVATFASIFQQNISDTPFTFTNNGPVSASFSVSVPIFFAPSTLYRSSAQFVAPSFPGSGTIAATLTINISTNTTANLSGTGIDQFMGNPTGTLSIVSTTTYDGLNRLLDATFNGTMNGTVGGNSSGFTSTTPVNTTVFTSDFVYFNNAAQRNFSLSFTNVQPALSIVNSFMSSWTGSGTGVFSADIQQIPEPTTLALVGFVGLTGFSIHRRRKNKMAAAEAAAKAAKVAVA